MPTVEAAPADGFLLVCDCAWHINTASEAGRQCPRCRAPLCLPEHHQAGELRGDCLECWAAVHRRPERDSAGLEAGAATHGPSTADDATGAKSMRGGQRSTATVGQRVTRRQRRRYRPRATAFAHDEPTAARQLEAAPQDADRLFLIGPPAAEAAVVAWLSGELPPGWSHDPAGHYLTGGAPVLKFRRPDGRSLELLRASSWFGEAGESCSPEAGAAAWRQLGRLVADAFSEGALLSSPAATGRYLFSRSIPFGQQWPVLSDELAELIRSTSGQARVELFDLEADELPQLVEYDGRFAYAGCCWQLPAGEPVHDRQAGFEGYAAARYRVRFTVPDRWQLAGVLPSWDGEAARWRWPNRPGERAVGWCDGSELFLAERYGWRFEILERIVWPGYTTRGPLDTWSRQLTAVRAGALEAVRSGELDSEAGAMIGAALRAVLLHAVGAFQGRPQTVTVMADSAAAKPADATAWRTAGAVHIWNEHRPAAWPEMTHPEWSAAIWGRARARLLSAPTGRGGARAGLLHLEPGQAVAARTDALYMTSDPRWPDDGAVGRFRRVLELPGPIPTPRTADELLALKAAR